MEAADTLTQADWTATTKTVGTLFTKDGAKNMLRNKASSCEGWTLDFTPAGARGKTLKIRLAYY